MHATVQPATPTQAHTHQYRPDIDGLRTLAVWLVVLFHAWPNWLGSGFIGVDIFFVISGFLITSIIIDDIEHRRYSIATFYSRRVRRIFPALLLVMGATLAFGWYVLMRTEFEQLGKHTASGAAFIANLTLWNESGYFDNSATTKPLLHLWSLGVEEQFYIVWPVLMWLFYRSGVRFLRPAIAIFALSFAYSLYATYYSPAEGYFSPVTRFWELMAGGICAHMQRYHSARLARWSSPLSLGGMAAIAVGAFFITEQSPFPGWWALAPVAGAGMLILAGSGAWANRRLFGNPVAVQLGLVSYPFYLWHWPLLAYAFIVYGERPPALVKAAMVGAALVLAVLTYRLLELPLKRMRSRRALIGSLCALMAALGLAGVAIYAGLLAPRLQDNGVDRYLGALNDSDFPTRAMAPIVHQGAHFQKLSGSGQGATIFIGDSVVEQYGAYATHYLREQPAARAAVIFATTGGCPPIEGAVRLPRLKFAKCTGRVASALALAASDQVDTVVIGAAWYGYFNSSHADIIMGEQQFPAPAAQEAAWAAVERSIAALKARGKRVFLVLTPPAGAQFDPRSMIEGSRFGQMRARPDPQPFDAAAFLQNNRAAHARLLEIARRSGAIVIDPVASLCPQKRCAVVDEAGEPVYTDSVHIRPRHSLHAAAYLAPALAPPR